MDINKFQNTYLHFSWQRRSVVSDGDIPDPDLCPSRGPCLPSHDSMNIQCLCAHGYAHGTPGRDSVTSHDAPCDGCSWIREICDDSRLVLEKSDPFAWNKKVNQSREIFGDKTILNLSLFFSKPRCMKGEMSSLEVENQSGNWKGIPINISISLLTWKMIRMT